VLQLRACLCYNESMLCCNSGRACVTMRVCCVAIEGVPVLQCEYAVLQLRACLCFNESMLLCREYAAAFFVLSEHVPGSVGAVLS
jgi:hypothetical protein